MGGPGSGRKKGNLSKTKKSVLKKTSYGKAVLEARKAAKYEKEMRKKMYGG